MSVAQNQITLEHRPSDIPGCSWRAHAVHNGDEIHVWADTPDAAVATLTRALAGT